MICKKSIILVSSCTALIFLCSSVFSYTLGKDAKGNFLSWDINSMPIKFWVHLDDSSSDDKDNDIKVKAVIKAFESWEIKSLSLVSFRYAGLTDVNKAEFDGTNVVTWIREGWAYNPDTIAYTTLWIAETGQILDADIELNGEFFDWSSNGSLEKMDIQNVLTHEVGHFIGIEHSIESTNLSMFPIISLGEVRKRIVKPDDIKASSSLYPVSSILLEVYEFPAFGIDNEIVLAEKIEANYGGIEDIQNLLAAHGIHLNQAGDAGLAALIRASGKYLLNIYSKPGKVGENVIMRSTNSLDVPDEMIKDFTVVDIDNDGTDELAVLSIGSLAGHSLYIYDSPLEGDFNIDMPKKWVARDLWRVPNTSDNLMLFGIDLEGDGQRELATLSYDMEGIYILKSFVPPSRFDDTSDDAFAHNMAISVPFTISGSILDIDSMDIDGDAVSEIVALVKGDFGFMIQVFEITIPLLPEQVQELKPLLTMPLVLEPNEYPFSIAIINGKDMEKPAILTIVAGTNH